MNKVHGGTPNHSGPSLCVTCREGQTIRGLRHNHHTQLCHAHGTATPIPWPVTHCNDYDDKRVPGLWQMEKIAWRFSVDDKRKTAGFMTAKEFAARFPDAE